MIPVTALCLSDLVLLCQIENGAPVASQNIPDGSGSSSLCWIYSGK